MSSLSDKFLRHQPQIVARQLSILDPALQSEDVELELLVDSLVNRAPGSTGQSPTPQTIDLSTAANPQQAARIESPAPQSIDSASPSNAHASPQDTEAARKQRVRQAIIDHSRQSRPKPSKQTYRQGRPLGRPLKSRYGLSRADCRDR